jgi:Orn/Lys/Arg decarboxylase, major domain
MLDPIKVSILAPGMGEDGTLEKTGVPAALVNAWFNRFGIVPTRVTDFQVMFLFSIGITKGKWGTLLTNLLGFKRAMMRTSRLPKRCRRLRCNIPIAIAMSGCTISATNSSGICARTDRASSSMRPSGTCRTLT